MAAARAVARIRPSHSKEITHAFNHSVPPHVPPCHRPRGGAGDRLCSPPGRRREDQPGNRHWVATWAVSPQRRPRPWRSTARPFGRSCTSAWEKKIRVWLSNAYGTSPLLIGAARRCAQR